VTTEPARIGSTSVTTSPGVRHVGLAPSLILVLVASAAPALADGPPKNYLGAFGGTTAAYRPSGGPWDGGQHDFALTAGVGRYVTSTLALEVDLGPTWVRGEYVAFSIVPSAVWSFSPHAYLAARFPVAVDPDTAAYAAPGAGLSHTFASGITTTLEVNGVTRLDKSRGDFGLAVTLGVLYSF